MLLSSQAQTQPVLKRTIGTVLVVEDEESIRQTIALVLESEGYRVVSAANGYAALEWLTQPRLGSNSAKPIDLLIVDLMLPGMNGLDLCRLLRCQGNTLPILMISGRDSEVDRVVGLEVGVDDYLVKPFGIRELVARCRALLRRCCFSPAPEKALSWREITLYPGSCRVTVRGEEVALAPKEFSLLALFMETPYRIWERHQLIDRIWGADYLGDQRTVDVHILWLRKKLERDPSQPEYIQTVRGMGYRFE